MKAVITGGAGFIGSRLASALAKAGWETVIVDDLSAGAMEDVPSAARFICMSVTDPEFTRLLADERPEVVYHFASRVDEDRGGPFIAADQTTNIVGTLKVLEGCRKAKPAKLILASTAAVFGTAPYAAPNEKTPLSPATPYGLAKRTAEKYTQWHSRMQGIPFTILRFANVYGPGQRPRGEGGVVAVFLDNIRTGRPLTIYGDGSQERDFVHVEDVVRACLASAEKGSGEIIHIGTGESWSVGFVARELAVLHSRPLAIRYADKRPADPARSVLPADKAAAVLGWSPAVRFPDGLRAVYSASFGGAGP
ncbi:NAD-dependent epimerase/dehydratase family protein [Paenibacillus humicola]|uniref:NAD-dependent epimerase/dehydratase family protein n=1 Tax=Paenibacillus humicola TaxID=3110540 RepID=UPI00237B33C5|nr:NAD-dependent epimerase/dehydratase family protein [Paenibacillus humicola]